MSAETTRLLNTLRKITAPLFNTVGVQRSKILRRCFPHPLQEGLRDLSWNEPEECASNRKHPDSELEAVNGCMREIHHCPFHSAQKARILNYGEQPMAALYHLKAQALYARLYGASICNVVFYSNPTTPEYETFPQCWLQWQHNKQEYFLDPVNYDCALPIEA